MSFDIKICGLTTFETLQAALARGATHTGFIFFEKSPRNITAQDAKKLADVARASTLPVAVTVNADDAFLDDIVETMRPGMLQLHGNETPLRVRELAHRYGLPIMKAFAIREAHDFEKTRDYLGIADRFLFDAKPPAGADLPGGNGVAFDWSLLTTLDADVDYMLSGGLNETNIQEALKISGASAIDISSGVETTPGHKSVSLINQFFDAVDDARSSVPK